MDFVRLIPDPDAADMAGWLRALRDGAHVPYSGYRVASVVGTRVAGGVLCFGGVNVESADQRLSTHGEESAIAAMVAALGPDVCIDAAWVMGGTDPADGARDTNIGRCCGNCRQQLAGLARGMAMPVYNHAVSGAMERETIGDLLPGAFGFDSFNARGADARARAVVAVPAATDGAGAMKNLVRPAAGDLAHARDWHTVLRSVDYASNISQSVILTLDNGMAVAGVRVENAAFTGLNAVQSALAVAVAAFGPGVDASGAPRWRVVDATVRSARHMDALGPDDIVLLPLSALQGLHEFAAGPGIPVTHLASGGDAVTLTLADWGADAPAAGDLVREIKGGLLLHTRL